MTFFPVPTPGPLTLPEGPLVEHAVYTGTACVALMDAAVTGEVWEDLLYDGVDHHHGSGGLMLNSASVGTHLEHDGDFPVQMVVDADGRVLGFRVNLDPYAEDLADVRELDGHGQEEHSHVHVHADGHTHDHPHVHGHGDDDHDASHDHGDGHSHGAHPNGWSAPETVRLATDVAVFGDPAGLPEADDTGDLVEMVFPAPGGTLQVAVYTHHGLRRELRAVWSPR